MEVKKYMIHEILENDKIQLGGSLIYSNESSANPTCYLVSKSVASCRAGPRNGASTGFDR